MGMFGDSFATNAAKKSAGELGTEGAQLFTEGQADRAALMPFFRGEMTASHAFSPTQLNELLTSAGAGAGGAAGSLTDEAGLAATRGGSSAGLPALIDKISRAKAQGLAKANEGIAAEDVNLTEANKQAGAAGMESLYGADTGNALKAMGLQQEAIKNEMEAANTGGWLRNLTQTVGTLSSAAAPWAKMAGLGAPAAPAAPAN